mgnify:CR=1 FL=1
MGKINQATSTFVDPAKAPLVVTGMHRSGTSLTAAFLQSLGIDLGEEFWQADQHNTKGYFEDVDFLQFQRSLLVECCPPDDGGWVDWGWTEHEKLDRSQFPNYTNQAKQLLQKRQNVSIWGWKDPRTTLLLDFWQELLPEAYFLLVYRFPWEVIDSILRLNAPVFSENPHYPLKIWQYYNRHLWDFYRKNSERCLLCNVNRFWENPGNLVQLLQKKFNLSIHPQNYPNPEPSPILDPQMFRQLDWQHPLVGWLERFEPECIQLLAKLDSVADLPSKFPTDKPISEDSHSTEWVLRIYQNSLQSVQQHTECLREVEELRSQLSTIHASKFWPVYQGWHSLKKKVLQSLPGKPLSRIL